MKIASIDIGLKRIGVALCLDESVVFPQEAVLRKNRNQAASDISKFLKQWQIDILVVGLPKDSSTSVEMERRIKHFVSLLDVKNINICYQDEQNTSLEAKELTMGIVKHKRDGRLDSIAAQLILQRWLSSMNIS